MITLFVIICIIAWLCMDRSKEARKTNNTLLYGDDRATWLYCKEQAKEQIKQEDKEQVHQMSVKDNWNLGKTRKERVNKRALRLFYDKKHYIYTEK